MMLVDRCCRPPPPPSSPPFSTPSSPLLRLAQDPCTQGVDISRAVVPLKEFSTLDGCTATKEVSASSQGWSLDLFIFVRTV